MNIPKGTFYLFYKSKELLLFEVIQAQHEMIDRKLRQALAGIAEAEGSAEKITDVIFDFFKMAEDMPILRLLDSEEIELLVRKLPQDVIEAHLWEDTESIEKLFALLPVKEGMDPEALSAAFHAIYFATLHRAEIGKEKYDQALRLLIRGGVNQMI